MKKFAMPGNVVFWRWLDPRTVAIVTDTAVFHWSMNGADEPQKMFERAAYDGKVQIVNYRASADGKFLILGGIAGTQAGIAGVLQLYAVDLKKSQPVLDAPAACFIQLTLDGKAAPSNLLCMTMRAQGQCRVRGDGPHRLAVCSVLSRLLLCGSVFFAFVFLILLLLLLLFLMSWGRASFCVFLFWLVCWRRS